MPVIIKILGKKICSGIGCEEYTAAEFLKVMFEKEFENKPNVNGNILIKPNFKAIGFTPEDIDIVVWINLEHYKIDVLSGHSFRNFETGKWEYNTERNIKNVELNSLLITIECKSHTNDGIRVLKNDVIVKYEGKESSALDQSTGQKYSLKNFISRTEPILGKDNIRITNLIWLNGFVGNLGFGQSNLKNLILGSKLDFKSFISKVLENDPPKKIKNAYSYYTNSYDHDVEERDANQLIENVFNFYDKEIVVHKGDLSRKKLENVIQKQLEGEYQNIFNYIGSKTTIIYGVPGSGKTLILLRFSYQLAITRGIRSLIITYNKALIADINRLAKLAGFKDDPSSASVGTSTCLKLMRKLFIEFNLYTEEPSELNEIDRKRYFKDNFSDKYEFLLEQLLIELKKSDKKELVDLVKTSLPELNYHIIQIDESQDWFPQERDILYYLFGSNNCVISFGSHQMLRKKNTLDWSIGVSEIQRLNLKTSYRQKTNLCHFIKTIGASLDLKDEIEINPELNGGRVRLYNRELTKNDFDYLFNYCVNECKNAAYDILLLVNSEDMFHKSLKHNNINIHDGTIEKNKGAIPINMEACRVFNYQSCRGLEGWVVIANNLDLFLQDLEKTVIESNEDLSLAETKSKVVAQWLYMILSRPIDTLVISFKNSNSPMAKLILKASSEHKDFCEILN